MIVYSVWCSSSTCYTKKALERYIKTFKGTCIMFHTYEFQLDLIKDLVSSKKVKTLFITHEDRSEEVVNG